MISVGAIYLQSTADKKLKMIPSNLHLFRLLSGTKGRVKVIFGTTKWEVVEETEGKMPECQFAATLDAMPDPTDSVLNLSQSEGSDRTLLDVILDQLTLNGNEEILDNKVPRYQDWLVLLGQLLRNMFKPPMTKRDNNLGTLPTDIVIPCDPIFLSHLHLLTKSQCYGPYWSWKKHCMLFVI
jgi:hypothetical protein